ncbi:hypothetical protein BDF14DRAFT_1824621 [Spinellus fusiger]|nr:hypothetical protein BDF14DRAFT_1824621 [Spinellus fusiger]
MEYRGEEIQPSNSAFLRWFGVDRFVPEHAVTSNWVSSKTLLWIRFPLLLYSTIIIWTDLGVSASNGGGSQFFGYFTTLTYVGLHAYLVTTFVHHVRYLRTSPPRPSSFLDQWAGLNYLYVWLYHTIVTFNIVTPVVYWSLLVGTMLEDRTATTVSWWLTGSVHAASFFMMITDVIFNRMRLQINMILPVLGTVVLFMFQAFIIHATTGWWVYPFLDWSRGAFTAVWYILVAAIVVVAFFLQMGIHYVRDRIAGRPHQKSLEDHDDVNESSQKTAI